MIVAHLVVSGIGYSTPRALQHGIYDTGGRARPAVQRVIFHAGRMSEILYNLVASAVQPNSPVAQSVERLAVNQLVAGSSPARGAAFLRVRFNMRQVLRRRTPQDRTVSLLYPTYLVVNLPMNTRSVVFFGRTERTDILTLARAFKPKLLSIDAIMCTTKACTY